MCKRHPPELVAQVRELRQQGLSFANISRQVGRGKFYIAWLVQAEGIDWPHERDGDDPAPVTVVV